MTIPAWGGFHRTAGATIQTRCGKVGRSGTGPPSRQLQEKVGGAAPVGLCLAERRRAALLDRDGEVDHPGGTGVPDRATERHKSRMVCDYGEGFGDLAEITVRRR